MTNYNRRYLAKIRFLDSQLKEQDYNHRRALHRAREESHKMYEAKCQMLAAQNKHLMERLLAVTAMQKPVYLMETKA